MKSGEAVLTKYQPSTSPDEDVEFEGREVETSYHDSQPTQSQRNEPGNFINKPPAIMPCSNYSIWCHAVNLSLARQSMMYLHFAFNNCIVK